MVPRNLMIGNEEPACQGRRDSNRGAIQTYNQRLPAEHGPGPFEGPSSPPPALPVVADGNIWANETIKFQISHITCIVNILCRDYFDQVMLCESSTL